MTLSTTSPGDERAEYEQWLRSQHKARFWNTYDAMFAAWQAGRASSSTVQQVGAEWMPIETAPVGREMFVARAVNVVHPFAGTHPYTSDPWCVWQDEHGKFARWPHRFPPTHWLALPSSPKSEQGDQQ